MTINHSTLRIVFAGTPKISADVLQGLLDRDYNIVGVLTQPDRSKGRGKKLTLSPVKALANLYQLEVFQPASFKQNTEILNALAELKPDVMVVIAYGLILPEEVLTLPQHGCVNIHLSLLPKWRGAAPIQRAIEAGDEKTGVCIMQMDQGLDTGDVLYRVETNIDKTDTTISLTERLTTLSIAAIDKVLMDINQGQLSPQKQVGIASYAKKLTKQEAHIDWKLPAEVIAQKIRAFNPWPGAVIILHDIQVKISAVSILPRESQCSEESPGKIVSVSNQGMDVQSGTDIVRIGSLQFPGKKMVSVDRLLNGYNLTQLIGLILR